MITIDLGARRLEVECSEAELATRRAAWAPPVTEERRGWLGRYQRLVTNDANGAVLA
jgi:dihydroxy-acid dehydratase